MSGAGLTEAGEIGEVRDMHRLDHDALDRWLRSNVNDYSGNLEILQFSGGASNPTYLLTSGERKYVLRKQPPGNLLQSAHQVDREYRIMAALSDTSVPVPVVRGLCLDRAILGTTFYVMDFLDGRIFRDATLPGLDPTDRAAVYDALNTTMACLHSVDWQKVGLEGFGRPGNYFERQIARWTRQYRDCPLAPVPAMEALIDELPRRIPADSSVAIAHGDFRLENVMFHKSEPRVIAVLDWELATIGHPLADLGYSGLLWHSHRPSWGSLDGIDFATSGIPTEREWVDAYCRRTGRNGLEDWNFLVAFAAFRLAAISHGVFARSLSGQTPSARAVENDCNALATQALELLHNA